MLADDSLPVGTMGEVSLKEGHGRGVGVPNPGGG